MAWYDPVSWFNSAKHDALKTIDDVKDWVLKRVKQLADELWSDLSDLKSWADQGLKDGRQALNDLGNDFATGIDTLGSTARQLVADAVHTAEHYADDVRHDLSIAVHGAERLADKGISDLKTWTSDLVKDAGKAATTLYHDAERYADAAVSTFDRDVVKPLENALSVGIKDAESFASKAVSDFYKDVVKPIAGDVAKVASEAEGAVKWIVDTGSTVAEMVIKASDWIVWLGEHTFDELKADASDLDQELTIANAEQWAKDNLGSWASEAEQIFIKIKG